MSPATNGVPRKSARDGDYQRLEKADAAFAQQIPSENPDKNTDAFGERELHRAERHGAQASVLEGRKHWARGEPTADVSARNRQGWRILPEIGAILKHGSMQQFSVGLISEMKIIDRPEIGVFCAFVRIV